MDLSKIIKSIGAKDIINFKDVDIKPHLKYNNDCAVVYLDSEGYITVNQDKYCYYNDFYLGVLTQEDAIKMGGYPVYRLKDGYEFEYMLTIPYEQFPDLCDDLSEVDKENLAYSGDYEYPNAE